MKYLYALLLSFAYFSINAQTSIPSYSVAVTFQKTTNIIFPYRIEKADIGSADVIGHKDRVLENVLFLKAGRKSFTPTNLSVYTSDGKFYSFIIRYQEEPDTLNLSFIEKYKTQSVAVDSFMDAQLDSDAINILTQRSILHRKTHVQELNLVLNGIYLKDHLVWIRFTVKNRSNIEYHPEYVRFTCKDKKVGRRTAFQETEISPAWQQPVFVAGDSNQTFVFGFPEFTISKQKKLAIRMDEKNGGRIVSLEIPARTLLRARSVQ